MYQTYPANNFSFFFVFPAPCRFRGERTGEKVVRLSEATPIGTEAFRVLAFPRRNFNIQALDGVRNCIVFFFTIKGHRGVFTLLGSGAEWPKDQA